MPWDAITAVAAVLSMIAYVLMVLSIRNEDV